MDAADVERRTGWRVLALDETASTNDEAARRAGGWRPLVVVAARQTAGRGRGGARFASPLGGLYASLALRVPVEDVPAPLVAAVGVAVARAVERVAPVRAQVKWPNDVWIDGRKVAGILVEATMGGRGGEGRAAAVDAVVGIGVNVARVPRELAPDVAAGTTAVDDHAPAPVALADLLVEVCLATDACVGQLATPAGRRAVEDEYRARAALLGRLVRYRVGDAEERGVLRDVSLDRGLAVERGGEVRWRPMALVRDLRRCEPASEPGEPAGGPGRSDDGDTFVTGPGEDVGKGPAGRR